MAAGEDFGSDGHYCCSTSMWGKSVLLGPHRVSIPVSGSITCGHTWSTNENGHRVFQRCNIPF